MAKNNRIPVKWVRDKAKSAYTKQLHCYICDTAQDLELHHLYSVTWLLETWAARKKYDISTDAGILAVRDEFIAEHHTEIYDLVYTLCNPHHVALHAVYGKSPSPSSVNKQRHWIETKKLQHQNPEYTKPSSPGGFFSQFTKKAN